jgi:hypothetical protein
MSALCLVGGKLREVFWILGFLIVVQQGSSKGQPEGSRRSARRPRPRHDPDSESNTGGPEDKDDGGSRDGLGSGGSGGAAGNGNGTTSELFSCPWPGCGKTFDRIKSRSAHLKWHGGSFDRLPAESEPVGDEVCAQSSLVLLVTFLNTPHPPLLLSPVGPPSSTTAVCLLSLEL